MNEPEEGVFTLPQIVNHKIQSCLRNNINQRRQDLQSPFSSSEHNLQIKAEYWKTVLEYCLWSLNSMKLVLIGL